MRAGPWESVADFDAWWKEHGREIRRMAVATPPKDFETITNPEWEKIAVEIERFQKERTEAERRTA